MRPASQPNAAAFIAAELPAWQVNTGAETQDAALLSHRAVNGNWSLRADTHHCAAAASRSRCQQADRPAATVAAAGRTDRSRRQSIRRYAVRRFRRRARSHPRRKAGMGPPRAGSCVQTLGYTEGRKIMSDRQLARVAVAVHGQGPGGHEGFDHGRFAPVSPTMNADLERRRGRCAAA